MELRLLSRLLFAFAIAYFITLQVFLARFSQLFPGTYTKSLYLGIVLFLAVAGHLRSLSPGIS